MSKILLHLFMGHHITALILKGKYSIAKTEEYDLSVIPLEQDLTMFHINTSYTEYWQSVKLKDKSTLDLDLYVCPPLFPSERVVSCIMQEISLDGALFAIIYTDYFGGVGEQFACVFRGNINQNKEIKTINEALNLLGVKSKNGFDEFDSIGLSNYRSQPDYLEKYNDLLENLESNI